MSFTSMSWFCDLIFFVFTVVVQVSFVWETENHIADIDTSCSSGLDLNSFNFVCSLFKYTVI